MPGCRAGPASATIENGAGCVCGGVNLRLRTVLSTAGLSVRANEATPDRACHLGSRYETDEELRHESRRSPIANRESDLGPCPTPNARRARRSDAQPRAQCVPRVRRERRGRAAAAPRPRPRRAISYLGRGKNKICARFWFGSEPPSTSTSVIAARSSARRRASSMLRP